MRFQRLYINLDSSLNGQFFPDHFNEKQSTVPCVTWRIMQHDIRRSADQNGAARLQSQGQIGGAANSQR